MNIRLESISDDAPRLVMHNLYAQVTYEQNIKALFMIMSDLDNNYTIVRESVSYYLFNNNFYELVDAQSVKHAIVDINKLLEEDNYDVITEYKSFNDIYFKIVYNSTNKAELWKVSYESLIQQISVSKYNVNILPAEYKYHVNVPNSLVNIVKKYNGGPNNGQLVLIKPIDYKEFLRYVSDKAGGLHLQKVNSVVKKYLIVKRINSNRTAEKYLGADDSLHYYENTLVENTSANSVKAYYFIKSPAQQYSIIEEESTQILKVFVELSTDPQVRIVAEYVSKYNNSDLKMQANCPDVLKWAETKNHSIEITYTDQCYDIGDIMFKYNMRNKLDTIMEQLAILYDKPPYATTLKKITNSVATLDKIIYGENVWPNVAEWYITNKTDGIHSVLYMSDKYAFIANNSIIDIVVKEPVPISLCEGELTYISGQAHFIIFDVLYYGSTNIMNKPFSERIAHIDKFIELCEKYLILDVKLMAKPFKLIGQPPHNESFDSIMNGDYPYEIDGIIFSTANKSYRETIQYKWKPNNSIDFLLKEAPGASKMPGVNNTVYWLFNGINGELFNRLHLTRPPKYLTLFPDNAMKTYFPVRFSPPDMPNAYLFVGPPNLDNKIVEMYRVNNEEEDIIFEYEQPNNLLEVVPSKSAIIKQNRVKGGKINKGLEYKSGTADNMKWRIYKIREDRNINVKAGDYFGNDYNVAERTWMIMHNPLTYEMLSNFDNKSYFKEVKQEKYISLTNYNSMLKSLFITNNIDRDSKWVIDFGSGKGQDIFRYGAIGVKNLTAIDIDQDALDILNMRRLEIRKPFKPRVNDRGRGNNRGNNRMNRYGGGFIKSDPTLNELPSITMICADVTDYDTMVKKFMAIKESTLADLTPCAYVFNFTAHYYIDKFDNVLRFIRDTFNVGGKYLFTSLDGRAVFDLLMKHNIKYGESYQIMENDEVKYRIERRFQEDTFNDVGQKIGVLLPFSKGQMYEEILMNYEYLDNLMQKNKCSRTHFANFDWLHFASEYKTQGTPANYAALTPADREWVKLHSAVVYE